MSECIHCFTLVLLPITSIIGLKNADFGIGVYIQFSLSLFQKNKISHLRLFFSNKI